MLPMEMVKEVEMEKEADAPLGDIQLAEKTNGGAGQDAMGPSMQMEAKGKGKTIVEDDEFEFDPFEGMKEQAPKWYAIALYYSSSRFLFDEMGAAWRCENPIPVRPLEDNRYVLEFDVEEEYNHVINGGPWRHKDDTLIVVPYHGFSR